MSLAKKFALLTVLRGHTCAVTSLIFLSSSLLVSGDLEGKLCVWDLVTRRIIGQYQHQELEKPSSNSNSSSSSSSRTAVSITSLQVLLAPPDNQARCKNSGDGEQHRLLCAYRDGWVRLFCVLRECRDDEDKDWEQDRGDDNDKARGVLSGGPVMEWFCGARHFCNISAATSALSSYSFDMFATSALDDKQVLLWSASGIDSSSDLNSRSSQSSQSPPPPQSCDFWHRIDTAQFILPKPGGMVTSLLLLSVSSASAVLQQSAIVPPSPSPPPSAPHCSGAVCSVPQHVATPSAAPSAAPSSSSATSQSQLSSSLELVWFLYIGFEGGLVVQVAVCGKQEKAAAAAVGADAQGSVPLAAVPLAVAILPEDQPVLTLDMDTKRGILVAGTSGGALFSMHFPKTEFSTSSTSSSSGTAALPALSVVPVVATQLPEAVTGTACVRVCPAVDTSAASVSKKAAIIASGHWDNSIRLFRAKNMEPLGTLEFHNGTVNAVAFPPPSNHISGGGSGGGGNISDSSCYCCYCCEFASASTDNSIALWKRK